MTVDPYLIATKLTSDAVVAYHAALQFHGKAYSLWSRYHYLTRHRARPFSFRGTEFVPVQVPVSARGCSFLGGGVLERRHAGGIVRATTLERALVDVLDAPGKAGEWEEIWRSLEMVEFFDLDEVVEYAARIDSALTVARVGFFLEQHQEELMVEERYLERLSELSPAQPRYLDNRREPGQLVTRWNLIVPERVLKRSWQEVV
jgi:predicted transcriptional regulator of viral defense system